MLPIYLALIVIVSMAIGYGIARWQYWVERHREEQAGARGGFVSIMAKPMIVDENYEIQSFVPVEMAFLPPLEWTDEQRRAIKDAWLHEVKEA